MLTTESRPVGSWPGVRSTASPVPGFQMAVVIWAETGKQVSMDAQTREPTPIPIPPRELVEAPDCASPPLS